MFGIEMVSDISADSEFSRISWFSSCYFSCWNKISETGKLFY